MSIAVLASTMLALPLVSIVVEAGFHSGSSVVVLAGRWFVFLGCRRSPRTCDELEQNPLGTHPILVCDDT